MANLTIALDSQLLRRARIKAVQQGTTVNALLRERLEEYAREDVAEPEHVVATREFLQLARKSRSSSGGRKWSREEMNARR